jgi:hypothetical protein
MSDEEYQAHIDAAAEASQQAEEQAMSEQGDKSTPEGWIAWHPDAAKGGYPPTESRELAEKLVGYLRRKDDGWRIRPVKLVFLDEVEK